MLTNDFLKQPPCTDLSLRNLYCGYRKGYSTQNLPIFMLKKWKFAADKGNDITEKLKDNKVRY